ncbi:GNAT family N-acetyltransferase [Streptomyces sp. NPDC093097]|uniref:GNAT family N-acetyltransferase n=1 Tax=Streptomyces sp. NPDC093097 TaxID=3366027 RepID=UPI00383086CD
MAPQVWPLYRLRITTPRLELRLPDLDLLGELAESAAAGVHDETRMPFTVPWTAVGPEERGRATFQYVLGTLANWRAEDWTLSLVVLRDGQVVGLQDLSAADFAVTREAGTGSWLGLAHQGQGYGTEMRAAVLHLAFAGLGARAVTSSAMTDNPASLRVSEKLGYVPDGLAVTSVQGVARTLRRLRLNRADWEAHRSLPVEIHDLAPGLPLFGL